jgi:hypothetical protein
MTGTGVGSTSGREDSDSTTLVAGGSLAGTGAELEESDDEDSVGEEVVNDPEDCKEEEAESMVVFEIVEGSNVTESAEEARREGRCGSRDGVVVAKLDVEREARTVLESEVMKGVVKSCRESTICMEANGILLLYFYMLEKVQCSKGCNGSVYTNGQEEQARISQDCSRRGSLAQLS